MNSKKWSGIFCLAVGILNLGMWTALIAAGEVPLLSEQLIRYIFHWVSEFSTAVLLVIAGLLFIKKAESRNSRSMYYLSSGFLINAINGAFWYYLINFSLPIFLMSGAVLALTIFLVIKNFEHKDDLVLLAVGTVVYGTINLLGYGFDRGDTSLLIYTVPMLTAVTAVLLLKTGRPAEKN